MSHVLALRILLLAAEGLAASAALPALAWLAAGGVRKRANLRHLLWLTAFLALLALPALVAILPAPLTLQLAAAAPTPQPLPPEASLIPAAMTVAKPPAFHIDAAGIAAAVLTLWLLGVAAFAVQGLVAALALRDLRQRSVLHQIPDLNLPRRAAGGRPWELRLSSLCAGPMTWGLARPTVLLPWEALRWSPERTRAVLLHELAHVRRRDSLSQTLAQLACALYWPNPLVWLAARALRKAAEIAADDCVIASGVRASDYAGELVSLAKEMRGQRLAIAGMAMANPSALGERVQSVLSPTPVRTGATPMDVSKIIVAGVLATSALALARPGLAEPKASAPCPLPVKAPLPARPALPAIQVAELSPPPAPAAVPAPPAPAAPPRAPKAPGHARSADDPVDSAAIDAEVKQAIAEAHIQETVAREIAANQARVQAEVARATADIPARVQKALAEARIEETVAKRLAEAQPKIEAAIARAQKERAEQARERAEELQQKP